MNGLPTSAVRSRIINVVLKQTSSIAQNAKIGGFLVSNYRQGILRKILNKQTLNNQIVLTTQQARLDEVILRGKIYFKGIVNPQQFLLEAVSDTSIQVYKTPSEITVTFQGVKFGGNSNLSIDAETVFKNPEFVCQPLLTVAPAPVTISDSKSTLV